ncbi:HNH endonuclease [Bacillaceae bacterium CLA-AA-H227]|uniref:HNH endonuclease n=1 Tax=Robertmurraya yapensis (ex Hitch et al 2024) TaxID=3133160 RepID=A0ACC6SHQ1_9BACI
MEVGTVCKLYKTCTFCCKEKYYTEFDKKSSRKRRGVCKKCFKIKRKLHKNNPERKDRVLKKGAKIKVQLVRGKSYSYKTSYEIATSLVKEGLAFVVSETKIFKPFSHKAIRRMIFERDSYTCFYCRKKGNTLEHIKPLSKGGHTTFSNCVVSCLSCNQKKGNLDFYEFINKVNTDLALRRLRESEKIMIERKFGIIQLLLQKVSEQVITICNEKIDNEEIAFKRLLDVEKEVERIKGLLARGNTRE